jgi:2-polyprenyl-3-methyl-5-hydroxy-6-metoxy-1,4-benzoquinol methylase
VVAIDVAAAQLERAHANAASAGVTIQFMQTNGLTVPPGPFDCIILWAQVLGNIERYQDQITLLMNCRRALHAQGIISASGHNKTFCQQDTPESTDGYWLYPWGKAELRYHLFTPDSFAALFRETGWQILITEIPPSLPAILYTVAHTP